MSRSYVGAVGPKCCAMAERDGCLSPSAERAWSRSHSKRVYQLAKAAQLGFTLPRTIVTNDEAAVKGFALENELVAKAVSSGYIKGIDGNRAIFTNALVPGDLEDLSGLALAPVIFQENIVKSSDIRVTVVGNDVFAAEILSQSRESSNVDWRATDDPDLEHRPHELPSTLARQCLSLVSNLGLAFGALHLRQTGPTCSSR